jgi:hypothetical protein
VFLCCDIADLQTQLEESRQQFATLREATAQRQQEDDRRHRAQMNLLQSLLDNRNRERQEQGWESSAGNATPDRHLSEEEKQRATEDEQSPRIRPVGNRRPIVPARQRNREEPRVEELPPTPTVNLSPNVSELGSPAESGSESDLSRNVSELSEPPAGLPGMEPLEGEGPP